METVTTKQSNPIDYGWFSPKAFSRGCDSYIYETFDGITNIEVTYVTINLHNPRYNYDDKLFMGKLGKYVKTIKNEKYTFYEKMY